MSALGQSRRFRPIRPITALSPLATLKAAMIDVGKVPIATVSARSLDDVVGILLKMHWYFEAEGFGGFHVNNEFKSSRLLDR
jgi:hypothetical protein